MESNFTNENISMDEYSKNKVIIRNKLIVLFVFDQMEVEITESTILDICATSNQWLTYIDCQQTILDLIELGYIIKIPVKHTAPLYTITPEGRNCLSCFYIKINSSTREEITSFVKQNRLHYKKKQQYFSTYEKNANRTFTVNLKINEPTQCLFDLKLNVESKNSAKEICSQWEEKAPQVYSLIYENLIE